jgi:hypothetical protein
MPRYDDWDHSPNWRVAADLRRQERFTDAAQARTADAIDRTEKALSQLIKIGDPFDQKDVRQLAGISSHFLHNHPDIRDEINTVIKQYGGGKRGRLKGVSYPNTFGYRGSYNRRNTPLPTDC